MARWFTARRDGTRPCRQKICKGIGPPASTVSKNGNPGGRSASTRRRKRDRASAPDGNHHPRSSHPLPPPKPNPNRKQIPFLPPPTTTVTSVDNPPLPEIHQAPSSGPIKTGTATSPRTPLVTRLTRHGELRHRPECSWSPTVLFVLNYPLVNHEHRKACRPKLIEECTPGAKVAFIESRNGEPTVLDKEAGGGLRGPACFDVFPPLAPQRHRHPTWSFLGIMFCFAKSAILRPPPRNSPAKPPPTSARHVHRPSANSWPAAKTGFTPNSAIAQVPAAREAKIRANSHLKGSVGVFSVFHPHSDIENSSCPYLSVAPALRKEPPGPGHF